MQYIKVTALGEYSSEFRCKMFSQELFKISRPILDDSSTQYLFGWVNKGEDYALEVDLNYVIYPHPEKDLTLILMSLSAMTTPGEVANIINVINTKNQFTFGEILPDNIQVFTREDLQSEGWFNESIYPI
jgi:hypothetical protein